MLRSGEILRNKSTWKGFWKCLGWQWSCVVAGCSWAQVTSLYTLYKGCGWALPPDHVHISEQLRTPWHLPVMWVITCNMSHHQTRGSTLEKVAHLWVRGGGGGRLFTHEDWEDTGSSRHWRWGSGGHHDGGKSTGLPFSWLKSSSVIY